MKIIALCTSDATHQLDHLAPLAHILNIPLYLTDPHLHRLCLAYYPQAQNYYIPESSCSLFFLANNADLLILSCKHWAKELSAQFKTLFNKSVRFCYAPHGNSDKGWVFPQTDLLYGQDLSFVYGNQMKEMLKERGVLSSLQGTITTGNYRRSFFEKYKDHYREIVDKEVFSSFETKQKTILYAPTWQDIENSTSFFKGLSPLIELLPSDLNLIVKLHPNLERDDPAKVYSLIGRYQDKKNVLFLTSYPLVYPLLEKIDGYIGDFSSLGYDFLSFDRPMFFLNLQERDLQNDPGLALFNCGKILNLQNDLLFSVIKKDLEDHQEALSSKRKMMYCHAFDEGVDFSKIKNELIETAKRSCY